MGRCIVGYFIRDDNREAGFYALICAFSALIGQGGKIAAATRKLNKIKGDERALLYRQPGIYESMKMSLIGSSLNLKLLFDSLSLSLSLSLSF
jgi:hypothetical protein